MLENEEKNESASFRVKEVQYIQAEVGPLLILLIPLRSVYVFCYLVMLIQNCYSSTSPSMH